MIYVQLAQDNSVEFATTSRVNPSQVELADSFFSSYPSPCWEYNGTTLVLKSDADSIRDAIQTEEEAPNPSVSPVQFKLLWTSAERISLRSLRTSDVVLQDFFDIIEDPRLTAVDLYLQSTQDGVTYAVNALVTAGTIPAENAATRISEILSGKFV